MIFDSQAKVAKIKSGIITSKIENVYVSYTKDCCWSVSNFGSAGL